MHSKEDEASVHDHLDETEEVDASDVLHPLFNMQNNSSKQLDRKNFACLTKIISGKCKRDNCPYGHGEATLRAGAKDLRDKMDAYLKTSNPSALTPRDKNKFSSRI